MGVDRVRQGQSAIFTANFGAGFTPESLPTWAVRNAAGALIVNGTAAQTENPAVFAATVTIPSNVPVAANDDRFYITWEAVSAGGNTARLVDRFSVVADTDFDFIELDQLVLEKSRFADQLIVDSLGTVNSFTITLMTMDRQVIFQQTVASPGTPVVNGPHKVYKFISTDPIETMTADLSGFQPLVVEWEYSYDGTAGYREYHFAYVVNPKALGYIRQVRMIIDKARRQHPNPALNYSDVDLAGYLGQGIAMLNTIRPVNTDWTLVSVPAVFDLGVVYAGAYSALQAQYLAEGVGAFDFSGPSVSLNVDRTPFIDATLARLKEYLDTQIPTAKRSWVRGGGTGNVGVLGLNISNSTPRPTMYYRAEWYRQWLYMAF